MPTNEQLEKIKRAIKENNDWFYDRPEVGKLNDKASEYAGMYFRLASKWLILNEAMTNALAIIEEQDSLIGGLRSELADIKEPTT